ncbi:uncharacterized protein PFB0765w [Denticeps clupeoides]|uniref:uncharacterized protein PFB0765w n=1 Tax=Denticeps clupeoides TaxID=299321 RepID=UPI0010A58C85|nr:uncharacterized protein PFB0765w-like [Denticeps clupeoides]
MSGTKVLLTLVLTSLLLLLTAEGRHVWPAAEHSRPAVRVLRDAKNIYEKYRALLKSFNVADIKKDDSTSVETTFIYACIGLEEEMNFTKTLLRQKTDSNKELERANFDLKKKIRQLTRQCETTGYETELRIAEMQRDLSRMMDQMGPKTTTIAKLTLEALSIYVEYKNIEAQIATEKSTVRLSGLKRQFEEKEKELKIAQNKLATAGGGSDLILKIVQLQEQIFVLQNKPSTEETKKRLIELKIELENSIKELEGSDRGDSVDGSRLVSKIITLQDEVLQVRINIQNFKKAAMTKLAELESELEQKKRQLKALQEKDDGKESSTSLEIITLVKKVTILEKEIELHKAEITARTTEMEGTLTDKKTDLDSKTQELKVKFGADYDLILKVIKQQFHLGETTVIECAGTKDADAIIAEIKKKLKAKEEENFELERENRKLQDKLKVKSKECTGLLDKIKDLERSLEEQIKSMKGETKPLLELISLNFNIHKIKMSILAEKSAVKIIDLKMQLKEKEREMQERMKELEDGGLGSVKALRIVSLLMQIWELQNGAENEMVLDRIFELQKDLNRLIDDMDDSSIIKLMLSIMAVQTDQSRINRLKIVISAKYEEEIAELRSNMEGLEKVLSLKKKELAEKDSDLSKISEEILKLKKEIADLNILVNNLKRTTTGRIDDLERELKIREKELGDATRELTEKDKKNGELIIRVTRLVEEIKRTEAEAFEKNEILAARISQLNKELAILKMENSKLKERNWGLEKEMKDCGTYQQKYTELKDEVDELMRKVDKSYLLILQVNNLASEIEYLRRKIAHNTGDNADLKKELEKKMSELERKKKELAVLPGSDQMIRIIEVIQEIHVESHGTSDKHQKRITELEENLNKLIKELDEKTEDNSKLVVKIMMLTDERSRYMQQLSQFKHDSAVHIKRLEKTIEEKQKEIDILRTTCTVDTLKEKIAALNNELRKVELELEFYKKSSAAKISELERRLRESSSQLEDASTNLETLDRKNAEMILKIVKMENEMTIIINKATTDKQILHEQVNDLKVQLKDCKSDKVKLQLTIIDLKENTRKVTEDCAVLNITYQGLRIDFDKAMKEVDDTSKLILQINLLYSEIEDLENKIRKSVGDKTDLQKQLDQKKAELEKAERDLGRTNPSSKKIQEVIAVIRKKSDLIIEDNEEYLQRIMEMEKEMDEMLESLQGKEKEKVKQMIKIMSLEDEVTMLTNRLSKTKESSAERMKEIQRELDLKYKEITELKVKDCGVGKLQGKIDVLVNEAKQLEAELGRVKQTSEDQVAELQKHLNEKNKILQTSSEKLIETEGENGALILKIISMENNMKRIMDSSEELKQRTEFIIDDLKAQLKAIEEENANLKARVTDLENTATNSAEECTLLKDKYNDLKNKHEDTLDKLDESSKTLLRLNMLNIEIEKLKRDIALGTGDVTELKKQLEQKTKEQQEAEKNLEKISPSSVIIKQIYTLIKEKEKVSEEDHSEYLRRVEELEEELDEMLNELQGKDKEKMKQMLQLMALQDEVSSVNQRLAKAKEDSAKKINDIQTQLEHKRNEINRLKAENCGTGKHKAKIDALEKEANTLEAELKRTKLSSDKEIEELKKLLEDKTKKLEASSNNLRTLDSKNADLIIQSIAMEDKMNKLLNQKNSAAEEIAELKDLLKAQEKEVLKLQARNKELEKSFEENKDCGDLRKNYKDMEKRAAKLEKDISVMKHETDKAVSNLEEELSKEKEKSSEMKKQMDGKVSELTAQLRDKEEAAAKLKKDLEKNESDLKAMQDKVKENQDLEEENNKLREVLKEKTKENEDLQQQIDEAERKKEEKKVVVTQQAIDPDTAHPNLKLSSDNKEMRVSDKAQEVADHPGRYNSVLGALGKTGFQKGRHYWEVTVAGKSCYTVGAASETAQRQGNVRYHPKNQYWTLRLQRNGQLQALDTRTSVLKVPANPDRIGVLVDFKKGDVSFYDAAARTHLYTFSGQAFTSQVFPFMSSCEDTEQGSPPIVFNPVASVDWL